MHRTRRQLRHISLFFVATIAALAVMAGASEAAAPLMSLPGRFGVSPTGAATYSIPIAVPPGTAGMVPAISLNYSSQNHDGFVGWGWSLNYGPPENRNGGSQAMADNGRLPASTAMAMLSSDASGNSGYSTQNPGGAINEGAGDDINAIVRCPRTLAQDGVHGGVNYNADDRFCLNGRRLVLVSGSYGASGSTYRTELDSFLLVTAHGAVGTGSGWFEVRTKAGLRLEYGNTSDSLVMTTGSSVPRAFALNKASDSKGNYLTVSYIQDTANGEIYPQYINYTGNTGLTPYNQVEFVYTTRTDQVPYYQAGLKRLLTKHLSEIKTRQAGNLVLDYQLAYREGTNLVHSRLTSITECDSTTTTCLPATTFTWQGGTGTVTFTSTSSSLMNDGGKGVGDFDGDGLLDIVEIGLPNQCFRGSYSGVLAAAGAGFPCASGLGTNSAIDINGDGRADVLNGLFSTMKVQINTGSGFTTPTTFTSGPIYGGDFDGDGRPDFMYDNGVGSCCTGYYYLIGNGDGTFSTGPTLPSGTWWAPDIADFDGDGCSDILHGNRALVGSPPPSTSTLTFNCNPAVSSVTLGFPLGTVGDGVDFPNNYVNDFNGDGKTDLVVGGILYLSTGTGFVSTGTNVTTLGSGFGSARIPQPLVSDFNGDGRADILVMANSGGAWPHLGHNAELYLSTGTSFVLAATFSIPDVTNAGLVADWNGDGVNDFFDLSMTYPTQNFPIAEYLNNYSPETIVAISNGVGATTNIQYDRLNKNGTFYTKGTGATYPTQDLDNGMFVVSEVDASNGLGTCTPPTMTYCYVTTYAYGGAKVDLRGRGFLGFTTLTVTDAQTGLVDTKTFQTAFPYTGMLASETVKTTYTRNGCVANTVIKSVSNTYTTATPTVPATPLFVGLQRSDVSGADCDGTALPGTRTDYTYDTYGNATQVSTTIYTGAVGGTVSSTSVTANSFTNDTTNWLFTLASTTTTNTLGTSVIARRTDYSYATGTDFLTQEIVEPTITALKIQTDYTLDSTTGVRTAVAVSGPTFATRTTSFTWDTQHRFVTSVTNPKSQVENFVTDPKFGGITSHTDANSLVSTATYDGFGRKTLDTRPDGNKTAYTYNFCSGVAGGSFAGCPTNGVMAVQMTPKNSGGTQNAALTTSYVDSLGRSLAAESQGFTGACTRGSTVYDANGRVYETSRPYFCSGGTPAWTVFTYDDLGRVLTATAPDTGVTSTAYHGLSVTVIDPRSNPTTAVKNPQGLTASITDALSHTATYAYDAFGDLASFTDPSSHATSSSYDARGHRTGSVDPDMGTWSYTYDALGELLTQTDAKSQVTTLTYDLLGRVTQRTEGDLTSTWTYDTATHGIGLLASEATPSGTAGLTTYTRSYTYDTLSRPTADTMTFPATTYTYGIAYNSDGRIDTVTYPSGFVAKYVYQTTYGQLSQIKDNASGTVLYTVNSRNAELSLTSSTAGNGVTTANTYDVMDRITNIRAGTSDAIAALDYAYDLVGSLKYRSDNYQGIYERFCYDGLNRLTAAAYGTTDPGTSCSGGTVKSVAYDAVGNITSKTGVGTYSYGATVQPHAVSSIAGTVNGVLNPVYHYDGNGNLDCIYASGGSCTSPSESVTSTTFNMAFLIVQGTTRETYRYGPNHERVARVSTVGGVSNQMLFASDPASGAYAELDTTGWSDYLSVDGHYVAMRSCVGTASPCTGTVTWRWFVTDNLGSIVRATDATGDPAAAHTERDSYDPWGRRRNMNGSDDSTCGTGSPSVSNRGFTGHEQVNTVCLVNANARMYDPTIGRFISPDTYISDLSDVQDWNPYSYVDNRPLSLTDPTGHDGEEQTLNQSKSSSSNSSISGDPTVYTFPGDAWGHCCGFGYTSLETTTVGTSTTTVREALNSDGSVLGTVGIVGDDGNVIAGTAQQAADIVNGAHGILPSMPAGISASAAFEMALNAGYYARTTVTFLGSIKTEYTPAYTQLDRISQESVRIHEKVHVDQVKPFVVYGCPWGCFAMQRASAHYGGLNAMELQAFRVQLAFLNKVLLSRPQTQWTPEMFRAEKFRDQVIDNLGTAERYEGEP